MTTNLATKQDLQHLAELTSARIDALEGRIGLMLQNLESRLVIRLGVLMTVLFGIAGTAATLLR